MKRILVALVALVALGGLLAACDDDDNGDTASDDATEQDDEASSDPYGDDEDAETPPPDGGAEVNVADTSLGSVLVDGEGFTLYVFANDQSDQSSCTGDCAAAWPALTSDGEPAAGDGVDATLGVAEQADGSQQVTVSGMPVYRFAQDAAPGDVNGQDVGGVWFAVTPTGERVTG